MGYYKATDILPPKILEILQDYVGSIFLHGNTASSKMFTNILLSAFVEGMELSDLYQTYRKIKKNQANPFDKILLLVEECENLYGLRSVCHRKVSLHTLKRLRKKLYRIRLRKGLYLSNHLQKSIEILETYISKLKEYSKKLYVCGERNSYSKTDPDATFMRMKEDAMLNGQLKPAYNLQHGVDSEYITWLDISPRPTDSRTLIPFLKEMEAYLSFKYQEIVADAGYESEENYLFLKGNGQLSYIKPQNYEISCPFKAECIKGNNCKTPLEDRQKVLYVSMKEVSCWRSDITSINSITKSRQEGQGCIYSY